MDLTKIRRIWEGNARHDAAYSVLSVPGTEAGKWDDDAFFATGGQNLRTIEASLQKFSEPFPNGTALDFGCGLGRLSRALAGRFASVTGVDISEQMVASAQRRNADKPNCHFLVNFDAGLTQLKSASFDLVLTLMVLQHMPRVLARAYLAAFKRVLAQGAYSFFNFRRTVNRGLRTPCVPSVRKS